MAWLKLTESAKGAPIYVNMALVVRIVPDATGGSTLTTVAPDEDGHMSISVKEPPEQILEAVDADA
jgi:hypothetical protein